jgi:HEAT repeat protein
MQWAHENPSGARLKHLEKTAEPRMHYMQAEKSVVDDLRLAGYEVNHIQDLYQKYKTYKSAIPILLKWLPRISHSDIKSVKEVKTTILSALDNKCARPEAIRPLIDEFEHFKSFEGLNDDLNHSYRWKVGASLSTIVDDSFADDLFRLVRNKNFLHARAQLVRGLKSFKDPRTVDVLIDLVKDYDLVDFAIYALGMLRAKKSRPYIEKFLNDPEVSVRQEAKMAIKRIDAQ